MSGAYYCLNDDSLAEHMAYFEERGVGIVNAAPLAMGLLSTQGPPAWHPASAALKNHARQAAAYCTSQDYSIEQLAIPFAVSHPGLAHQWPPATQVAGGHWWAALRRQSQASRAAGRAGQAQV